jgi:hypothetical protein
MTGAAAGFDAEYGESWDAERRALVESLTIADAERRHSAGEPYAVLIGRTGRPRVLLELEGRRDEITGWCFDEQLRRAFLFEFRTLVPGRMALIRMAEWRYVDAGCPEFDPTSPGCLTTFGKGGTPVVQAVDAPAAVFRTLEARDRWIDAPRFGTWAPLVAFVLDELPERERIVDAAHGGPTGTEGMAPAEPGCGPLQAGPELVAAFGPSARYALEPDSDGDAPEVVVETRPAGALRMPTGRLVAVDPGWLGVGRGVTAFGEVLPRGYHPVTLAVARFVERPRHVRVAACRVQVRDVPVVCWEQALRPGEDAASLGDGEFFGVGVDSGTICFFDAGGVPSLIEAIEDWDGPRHAVSGEKESAELEDPRTGTNVIAFYIGWGDGCYPVWIGRGADGEVACVVADGGVLCDATYLGPVE